MFIAAIILTVFFGMMIPSAIRADRRAAEARKAEALAAEARRRALLGL